MDGGPFHLSPPRLMRCSGDESARFPLMTQFAKPSSNENSGQGRQGCFSKNFDTHHIPNLQPLVVGLVGYEAENAPRAFARGALCSDWREMPLSPPRAPDRG